jgi:hypothetical protein
MREHPFGNRNDEIRFLVRRDGLRFYAGIFVRNAFVPSNATADAVNFAHPGWKLTMTTYVSLYQAFTRTSQ